MEDRRKEKENQKEKQKEEKKFKEIEVLAVVAGQIRGQKDNGEQQPQDRRHALDRQPPARALAGKVIADPQQQYTH